MSETKPLPQAHDVLAPDGSEVRILLATSRGSMAHFQLPPGQTTQAVRHRGVEEIWYILSGTGEIWRADAGTTPLTPGLCLTIPTGIAFQFRNLGPTPLAILGITMPPWPGADEAEPTEGIWPPTSSVGDA